MMAQPHHTWGLFDAPTMRPTVGSLPRDDVAEDEDLFNAALLFLDHHDDSLSDASDSYSVHTAEDATPYQQEPDHYAPATPWAPTHQSFQDQLADVDLHLPLDTPAPALFLDATASLALDALSAPAWKPSQAPSPTPPRRINKRRLEIERLRVESQSLTKRLANLKDHTGESPSSDTTAEHAGVAELLGSAWQNIAARQLEQRHRSEAENRRLKNLLNEHKRMAKALRRLVARHANTKAWDPLQTAVPPRPVRGAPDSAHLDAMDDPAIFDQLAETLDSMYAETDAILSDPSLAAKDASQSDVKTERDGDKGLRVQVQGARTMPFGFTATSETVWDYMFRHCGPKVLQWEPTDRVDTFRTDFVAYTEMCHIKGFGRAKMMLRRVDEPHRVVLMRSALYQCPGSEAGNGSQSVRRPMRHCMWKIIRKPTGQSTKDDVCQIVSCELLKPALEVEGLNEAAREAEAATLATMCTQISRFHATQADIFIDNSLLRPAAQSPREVEAVPQCLGATEVVW